MKMKIFKTRASRLRLFSLVVGAGVLLIYKRDVVRDYAQALKSPNGLYVPDARHILPPGTPPGFYSHTFRIYNARPRWASVEVTTDCGCTSLSWHEARIAPFAWRDTIAQVELIPHRSLSASILMQTKNFSSPDTKLYLTSYNIATNRASVADFGPIKRGVSKGISLLPSFPKAKLLPVDPSIELSSKLR